MKFRGYKNVQLKWIKELKSSNDLAINKEKTRIYVTEGNVVVSFDLSGKEIWRYPLPDYGIDLYYLHIGADGTLYAVRQPDVFLDKHSSGHITALTGQGTLLWERELDDQEVTGWISFSGSSQGTLVTLSNNGIVGLRNGNIV